MDLLQQLFNRIMAAGDAWVVGGAVRDYLLGLETSDLDLVVTDASLPFLASALPCDTHCFWLDQERRILRITQPPTFSLDVAPLQGEDIQHDLQRRDFTVNAMAIPLTDWLQRREAIIDPYSGRQDLAAAVLRPVSVESLADDPVRILRGIRLAVTRDLALAEETQLAMRAAAPALPRQAAERISAELSNCFTHPRATMAVELMLATGVTHALFPEVVAMQQVTQNKYHQFTVDEHSHKAFATFVELIHAGSHLTPQSGAWLREFWTSLPEALQTAAMVAAWLHDIGKPATRAVREERVTFYNHEQVGAEMALAIARRLKLSNAQQDLIKNFVRWHMYPVQLWRSERFGPVHIHRFYRRVGQYGPLVVAFSLADYLAKGDDTTNRQEYQGQQELVETFLAAYFRQQAELIAPPPLLDGQELMRLAARKAGPWLRRAKAALLEAQVAGQISDKTEATLWLAKWLRQEE